MPASEPLVYYPHTHEHYPIMLQYVNDLRARSNLPLFRDRQPAVVMSGELLPEVEAELQADMAGSQPQPQQKNHKKARTKHYGRWELLNNWVDYGQHYFSTPTGRVWLTIFRLADGHKNTLEFAVRYLAYKAGVSPRVVQKAVTELTEAGVLICIFKSPKKGIPSKYRLADATNELTKRPAKPR